MSNDRVLGELMGGAYTGPDEVSFGEWQPIATAPKDGTWIIVCGGRTDEYDYSNTGVNTARPVVSQYDIEDEEWNVCFWDGAWRTGYSSPTHWMPLPPAPKGEAND